MSGKPKGPKKTKADKAKVRVKKETKVIDIDFANRDNIIASIKQNTKINDMGAKLIASAIVEFKQLLVKNWRDIRDINDEFHGGKIKCPMALKLDTSVQPEIVKVYLTVPRPSHKDSAETTTEDPQQLTIETVEDQIPVGGKKTPEGEGEGENPNLN